MPGTSAAQAGFVHDEEAFRKKIPYPLVSTNVKGVYASPAPSADFDPNKASVTDLVKNGFHLRRPAATDDPALSNAWQKFFSRKWLAKDRIVPELHPQIGRTHLLKAPVKKVTDQSFLATTWSGAGIRGGTVNGVIGLWHVPTVSVPSEPQGLEGGWNSASWCGIDGFNIGIVSNDVLQAGIEQRILSPGSAPVYVAWFEWFAPQQPNSPPYIFQTNIPNFPVSPGDEIYCAVQYSGNTAGTVSLANYTTGQHFSITLAPPPGATFAGNSVEWVMEAPDGGEPISSLPEFTPVAFTDCLSCGPSANFVNHQVPDIVNVETAGGKVLTSVALGNFAVTINFIG
jgi:hypothetical protein